jgi:hypothetical protein
MSSSAVSQKQADYESLVDFQPHRAVEFTFDAATRTDRLYREIMNVGCSVLTAAVVAAALHIFVRVPHPWDWDWGCRGFSALSHCPQCLKCATAPAFGCERNDPMPSEC